MITDTYLTETAKAINNESYKVAAYGTIGTGTVTAIAAADTALYGEIGTREALTGTRTVNAVEFSFIRSGADVQDTANGDALTNTGLFNTITQSTTDLLLTGVALSGITQTTNFDIEFLTTITPTRA